MTLTDTLTELNNLCSFFMDAEEKLQRGKTTDISGIDARVSTVCKKVSVALPEQQKDYLPLMTTLIDLLNNYEKALISLQKENLQEAIKQKRQEAGR